MSNELKCTGGDWEVNPNKRTIITLSSYARIQQIIEIGNCDSLEFQKFTNQGEAENNARLIAASKDLYNSLVDMVEGFWWDSENEVRDKFRQENPGHPFIKAEAAIIKANSEYNPL